jgi:hypothetical protein
MDRYMNKSESAGEEIPAPANAAQCHEKAIREKSTQANAMKKITKLNRRTTRLPVWGVLPSSPRRVSTEERENRKAGTRATASKGIRDPPSSCSPAGGEGGPAQCNENLS